MTMAFTQNETIKFPCDMTTESCCNCGVAFAIPTDLMKRRLSDGKWFYCPNGHGQFYTETAEQKLRKQLAQEQHRREQVEADRTRYQREAEHQTRRASAARGQVTRLKNRVGSGVCPCCNRYFAALHRHISNQHPDFKAEQPSDASL